MTYKEKPDCASSRISVSRVGGGTFDCGMRAMKGRLLAQHLSVGHILSTAMIHYKTHSTRPTSRAYTSTELMSAKRKLNVRSPFPRLPMRQPAAELCTAAADCMTNDATGVGPPTHHHRRHRPHHHHRRRPPRKGPPPSENKEVSGLDL